MMGTMTNTNNSFTSYCKFATDLEGKQLSLSDQYKMQNIVRQMKEQLDDFLIRNYSKLEYWSDVDLHINQVQEPDYLKIKELIGQ